MLLDQINDENESFRNYCLINMISIIFTRYTKNTLKPLQFERETVAFAVKIFRGSKTLIKAGYLLAKKNLFTLFEKGKSFEVSFQPLPYTTLTKAGRIAYKGK